MDPRSNEAIYPLLECDVEPLYRYFAPYAVAADTEALAFDLWTRFLIGELL